MIKCRTNRCHNDNKFCFPNELSALTEANRLFKECGFPKINRPYKCRCGAWKLTSKRDIKPLDFKKHLAIAKHKAQLDILEELEQDVLSKYSKKWDL